MRKASLYIFSCFFLALYVLSLNRPFMEWWADFRTYKLNAPHAKARYGDLYSNCFLPAYMDTAHIPLKTYDTTGGITDLYILHDSYLADKIGKANFKGINRLVTADYRGAPAIIKPDPSKYNILIIECSERTAFWRLSDTATAFAQMGFNNPAPALPADDGFWDDYVFNANINQNLEFALYDYEWFRPIKHFKAELNFSLFNRLPHDVAVSTDKKYLLLNETVDPASPTSSFTPIDPRGVAYVVKCMNRMRAYYKAHGFDKIYFSIVPNPVSIVDRKRMHYNNKIAMLEHHRRLRVPALSVECLFRRTRKRIYRRDDSHWNGNGLQVWLDEVNKIVKR